MVQRRNRGAGSRWIARGVQATQGVDAAFRLFERLRSRLVLTWASDRFLDAYNDLAYPRSGRYQRSAEESALLPWEADIVRRFFPAPPARVLVGGAGGGREAFALARIGYDVVAMEPSAELARIFSHAVPPGLDVRVFMSAYEDLPRLSPADGSTTDVDVNTLPPFDAALLGLSSFSHVRHEAERLRVFGVLREIVRGPVVLSFFGRSTSALAPAGRPDPRSRLRRLISSRLPLHEGDWFSADIGFVHSFSREELEQLAARAGFEILHLDLEANWNHAVLRTGGSTRAYPLARPATSSE